MRVTSDVKHRREDIRSSAAMVCLVTETYLDNPAFLEDVRAADADGKPIIALVRRGVVLPPGAFPARTVVLEWATREDLERLAPRIRAELHLAGAIPDPDEPVTAVSGPLPPLPGLEPEGEAHGTVH